MFGKKTIIVGIMLIGAALALSIGSPAAIPTAASVVQAGFLELHGNAHLENL
jgi:hypothetical protein